MPYEFALASVSSTRFLLLALLAVYGPVAISGSKLHPLCFLWCLAPGTGEHPAGILGHLVTFLIFIFLPIIFFIFPLPFPPYDRSSSNPGDPYSYLRFPVILPSINMLLVLLDCFGIASDFLL